MRVALKRLMDHATYAAGVRALIAPEVKLMAAIASILKKNANSKTYKQVSTSLLIKMLNTCINSAPVTDKLLMKLCRRIALEEHGLLEHLSHFVIDEKEWNMCKYAGFLGTIADKVQCHEILCYMASDKVRAPFVFLQVLHVTGSETKKEKREKERVLEGLAALTHNSTCVSVMLAFRPSLNIIGVLLAELQAVSDYSQFTPTGLLNTMADVVLVCSFSTLPSERIEVQYVLPIVALMLKVLNSTYCAAAYHWAVMIIAHMSGPHVHSWAADKRTRLGLIFALFKLIRTEKAVIRTLGLRAAIVLLDRDVSFQDTIVLSPTLMESTLNELEHVINDDSSIEEDKERADSIARMLLRREKEHFGGDEETEDEDDEEQEDEEEEEEEG